jgi:hypothetical protein
MQKEKKVQQVTKLQTFVLLAVLAPSWFQVFSVKPSASSFLCGKKNLSLYLSPLRDKGLIFKLPQRRRLKPANDDD